jgi:hypothetical protein
MKQVELQSADYAATYVGKKYHRRSLQSCTYLRKEVAIFHPLKRRPQTDNTGTSVDNLQDRTIFIIKDFIIST